ncbi:ABC transporter ATP-binding protein [Carnobacterium gallinarum]|uniref:ABC transporter ATP-binding protein n=1 Tax=Carnobacterium gallinarum TaxID=2749 RepID=UPI00055898A5|nr:ABC transporter ATP-binding protein [Carnobacterium gallinarum]
MNKMLKKLALTPAIVAILFLLVQAACDLYIPTLTANMINQGIVNNNMQDILKIGGIMLGFSLVSFAAALVNTYISAKISYRLGNKIREEVYQKILAFSNVEFDRFGASSLITRNTNDVTQIQSLVEMGLKFLILAPIYLVGGVYLSYRLSPALTVPYLLSVPLLLLISIIVFKISNPLFEKMQKSIDKLNLIFKEGLTGMKVIHAFNRENEEYSRYEKENQTYTGISIKSNTLLNFIMPFMYLVMSIVMIVVTWLGAGFIDSGSMEIGTLIGVTAYSTQILMGVGLITNVVSSIPRGQVSAKRVHAILDHPLAITNGEITHHQEHSTAATIAMDHVSFTYQGAEKAVFQDINFSVNQGESIAIIGSTGSGKTTLINLINRFYDVSQGSIKLFGEDIRHWKESALHDEISLVPQQNSLFFGTVRENLQKAKPDAGDELIWWALEQAEAAEFLRDENGLDTAVEKNGGNFSGGQRQRLCLARAFIKKAAIYVFDDSFSALDFKTDALIQQHLQTEFKEAAKIIVAQRITTVKNATRILVLDKGQVAGYGTHESLAAENSVYQEIINSQTEEKERV